MKKYIKPEIVVDQISIAHPLADLSVNANADYTNIKTDSWSEWESLFD